LLRGEGAGSKHNGMRAVYVLVRDLPFRKTF
jgi:hypothetical protein